MFDATLLLKLTESRVLLPLSLSRFLFGEDGSVRASRDLVNG